MLAHDKPSSLVRVEIFTHEMQDCLTGTYSTLVRVE